MSKINKQNDYGDYVINYLNMASTGALLFTGEWGSGKTFYIKNVLFDRVAKEAKFTPILVSLYGEKTRADIAKKLMFAYLDKKGENVKLSTGSVIKNLKYLSNTIPILNKYFNVENLLIGAEENIFNFLPKEKLLICFDDFERMSKEMNPNDFLGLVNELVENKGAKVLIIANEEKIEDEIIYKEKTIEKTIHYSPEIQSIVKALINNSEEKKFIDFCTENTDFITKSITLESDFQNLKSDLHKSLSNIRTLKFAIEHFRNAFTIVSQKLDISNDAVQKKLRNIWLFVLAISAEYKKPNNISFKDRKGIDQQISPIIGNFRLKAKIEVDQIEETSGVTPKEYKKCILLDYQSLLYFIATFMI